MTAITSSDRTVAATRSRTATTAAIVVVVVAALVRALYLFDSSDNPTFTAPIIDAHTYHELAREVAQQHTVDEDIFWQPVFYPLFLGGVYTVFGTSIAAAKILQAVLGCVTCLLVWRLGRQLFGLAAGTIAGLVLACYGPAVFFETELLATGWASFWAVALLLLFLRARAGGRWWLYLGLGACCALAVLNRTTFLPFVLLCGVWLGWRVLPATGSRRSRSRSRPWLASLLVVLGWLACMYPVDLLRKQATGRDFFLPTSGELNLYIGNNADFERTVTTRPGWQWTRLRTMPQRQGRGHDIPDAQRFFKEQVIAYAKDDPLGFLGGLVQKTLHFVNSRELVRNVDIYLFHEWSPLLRVLVWKWGGFGFPFGLILPLAVVGLITGWRRVPLPAKVFLLVFPATIILFFVAARYRLVVAPILVVLAGQGCVAIGQMYRTRQWRRLGLAAGGLLAVLLLAVLPGPFAQERIDLEPEIYEGVGTYHYYAEQWEPAAAHLERAIALRPEYVEAHNFLGIVRFWQGRYGEARAHIVESARLAPGFTDATTNLQRLREAANDFLQRGRTLGAAGELALADTWLGHAATLAPDDADIRLERALVLVEQGDTAASLAEFRAALANRPDWPEAAGHLAWELATATDRQLRDGPEAVVLAQQTHAALGPDNAWTLGVLAAAYAQAGRFDEAVDTGEAALRAAEAEVAAGAADRQPVADLLRRALAGYRTGRAFGD